MRSHVLLGVAVFGGVFWACGGKALDKEIWLSDPTASAPTAKADIPPPADDPRSTSKPTPTKPASCAVSFSKDVMVVLETCSASSCHGRAISDPLIDIEQPDKTYAALTTFRIGKTLFVDPSTKDPDSSAILCNLRGEADCGVKMPLGGSISDDQLDTIEQWLACGAPQN